MISTTSLPNTVSRTKTIPEKQLKRSALSRHDRAAGPEPVAESVRTMAEGPRRSLSQGFGTSEGRHFDTSIRSGRGMSRIGFERQASLRTGRIVWNMTMSDVPFEAEFWFRRSAARRDHVESQMRDTIAAMEGELIERCVIPGDRVSRRPRPSPPHSGADAHRNA